LTSAQIQSSVERQTDFWMQLLQNTRAIDTRLDLNEGLAQSNVSWNEREVLSKHHPAPGLAKSRGLEGDFSGELKETVTVGRSRFPKGAVSRFHGGGCWCKWPSCVDPAESHLIGYVGGVGLENEFYAFSRNVEATPDA
jgi:hypothetical protein